MAKYLIIAMFLLSLALADDNLRYGIQDEPITLVTTCTFQGIVDDNANATISLSYPNGTFLFASAVMNQHVGYQSYVLPDTTVPGTYDVQSYCDDGVDSNWREYQLVILPSEYSYDNQGIDYRVLIGGLVIGLLFFGFFLMNRNIVLGYSSASIVMVTVIIMWVSGVSIKTDFNSIAPIFYIVPTLITVAIGFALVMFSIWIFYYSIQTKEEDNKEFEIRPEE